MLTTARLEGQGRGRVGGVVVDLGTEHGLGGVVEYVAEFVGGGHVDHLLEALFMKKKN